MDHIKEGWFSEISEELWPGQAMSLRVDEVLHSEKSQFQDILVISTSSYGKVLILDGIIQCSQKDEFAYQEMIAFLPLCCHKKPEKVLIVGGGDGGVAREVVKHPLVDEVHQVEIDARVIAVSKKYLPFMAEGFKSEIVTVHVEDGFEYMKNHKNEFDVIITDSSDPVGPAVSLFQEDYFLLMKEALRDDGIVCSQGSNVWTNLDHVKSTINHCKKHFPSVSYATASVPTYPTGQIGFVIGSLKKDQKFTEPSIEFDDAGLDKMKLKYYCADIHRAAFALPRFAKLDLNS